MYFLLLNYSICAFILNVAYLGYCYPYKHHRNHIITFDHSVDPWF